MSQVITILQRLTFVPYFCTWRCNYRKNYADNELIYEMNKFKQKVFGTTDIILHTAEICRNKNKFLCLKDKDFREFFIKN